MWLGNRSFRGGTAGLWLLLVMCSAVFAGTTGKIAGRVTDAENGDPVIGAAVLVEGTTLGAAADINGEYFILNVPPGIVTLKVNALGYAPQALQNLRVITDQTTTADIALGVEAISTGEVVVTAERKIIEADRTFATSTVGSADIAALPVTNLGQVVEIQAGVVDGHFRGGRSSEVMYLVDGISVTDAYDNSQGTQVDDGVVQELQVISGTFNAEYGQAMSGVVNIITKEGAKDFHGTATSEFGDYVSQHDNTWMNIGHVSPLDIQDYTMNLYGPVPFIDKLSFYGSFRYLNDQGWLYGQRRWNVTWDTIDSTTSIENENLPRGDNSYAAMNYNLERWGNLKLTYPLTDRVKLNYSTFYSGRDYKDYSHDWKYVPDGTLRRYKDGRTNVLKVNHALSSAMFYEAALTNTFTEYQHYVFEDLHDARYVPLDFQDANPPYTLNVAGTDLAHFRRWTNTNQATGNLSYQMSKLHLGKVGFDVKLHDIFYEDINVVLDPQNNFVPTVEDVSRLSHDKYKNNPGEYALYFQDKFELPSLIVNVGFRFDYFDPDGRLLADPKDPNIYNPLLEWRVIGGDSVNVLQQSVAERSKYWYKDASAKSRLSPRLGIAYPMSDKGVFHFAYGHFVQRPTFERMYANPEYELESGVGLNTVMGNPDLDMEETVSYEFGFQQQIHEDVSISTSLFFRDIRSLVATDRIVETYSSGTKYAQYVNRSFGEVKGITLSMDKRMANNFSAFIDYTYQIAEGNASDPQSAYNDLKGNNPREPEQQLVPLDWDRRHTLNASLTYAKPGRTGYGATMLGKYGSGLPYSPTDDGIRTGFENDGRRPDYYNLDLNLFKSFPVGKNKILLTATVQNVIDIRNEDGVYDDTGRAGYTIVENDAVEAPYFNTLSEVYPDPSKYSRPRLVKFGVSYEF
jgi:outer membrane receptor for ferrienterochelin and colicin